MAASFSAAEPALSAAAALLPVTDAVAGPWPLLAGLLFATFLLHLLIMNALVGCALLTLAERLRPASGPPAFGRESDVLLPKGVAFAVNLGIPPFLFLQCVYGQYIYSSSILMGLWWLAVMLVVMLAYYGLYINMARPGTPGTPDAFGAARTTALGVACLLLLCNAFIFVNNMTLLQNPGAWAVYADKAGGVFLNLAEPQLVPRYLHVILSCLAVGGLCLALPAAFALRRAPGAPEAATLARRKKGMRIFLHATLLQIPVGLWFFLALPGPQRRIFMGGDALASGLFMAGLLLTGAALYCARKERVFAASAGAALLIVFMAGMRSLLRASYLADIYDPPMRAMDVGPFLLFAGSLALSALFLAWMVRLYYRHCCERAPDSTDANAAGRPTAGELRDALLINEVARTADDARPEKGAAS